MNPFNPWDWKAPWISCWKHHEERERGWGVPIHWGPHTPFRSTGISLGITEDGASGQASVHGTVGDRESTCKNCSEQRSHEGTLPDYHALSGQSWGEDGEPGGPHTLFSVCCQPPRGGSELHVLSATQRVMPRTSGLASVGIGTVMENPRHPEPPSPWQGKLKRSSMTQEGGP